MDLHRVSKAMNVQRDWTFADFCPLMSSSPNNLMELPQPQSSYGFSDATVIVNQPVHRRDWQHLPTANNTEKEPNMLNPSTAYPPNQDYAVAFAPNLMQTNSSYSSPNKWPADLYPSPPFQNWKLPTTGINCEKNLFLSSSPMPSSSHQLASNEKVNNFIGHKTTNFSMDHIASMAVGIKKGKETTSASSSSANSNEEFNDKWTRILSEIPPCKFPKEKSWKNFSVKSELNQTCTDEFHQWSVEERVHDRVVTPTEELTKYSCPRSKGIKSATSSKSHSIKIQQKSSFSHEIPTYQGYSTSNSDDSISESLFDRTSSYTKHEDFTGTSFSSNDSLNSTPISITPLRIKSDSHGCHRPSQNDWKMPKLSESMIKNEDSGVCMDTSEKIMEESMILFDHSSDTVSLIKNRSSTTTSDSSMDCSDGHMMSHEIKPPYQRMICRRRRRRRKPSSPKKSADPKDPSFKGVTFQVKVQLQENKSRLAISAYFNCCRPRSSPYPLKMRSPGSCMSNNDSFSSSESEAMEPPRERKTSHHTGKQCASCGTRKTPLWRDAEDGTPLCNACGIRYRKYRVRCTHCWYIPKKDNKMQANCMNCGELLRFSMFRTKAWT